MGVKLLNPAHENMDRKDDVISARKATSLLGVSNHTFINAVDSGIIIPHQKIDKEPRPDYGFEPEYIEEIRRVLLKGPRSQGKRVFDTGLKDDIEKINRKWFKNKK